jgi:hypothetical protein
MTSIHSSAYAVIIDALVAARKATPMTQVELAEIWKKSQPIIAKIEQRERRLDVAEFLELCDILNANPTDIIRTAHLAMKKEKFGN